jgi:hypothetical protein
MSHTASVLRSRDMNVLEKGEFVAILGESILCDRIQSNPYSQVFGITDDMRKKRPFNSKRQL